MPCAHGVLAAAIPRLCLQRDRQHGLIVCFWRRHCGCLTLSYNTISPPILGSRYLISYTSSLAFSLTGCVNSVLQSTEVKPGILFGAASCFLLVLFFLLF